MSAILPLVRSCQTPGCTLPVVSVLAVPGKDLWRYCEEHAPGVGTLVDLNTGITYRIGDLQ